MTSLAQKLSNDLTLGRGRRDRDRGGPVDSPMAKRE